VSRLVTLLIDLPPTDPSHRSTVDAVDHAIAAVGGDVSTAVTRTDAIERLGDGVVIGPGSPYRDPRAAESVIEACRRDGIPLVGT
jgi:hypothetical protein